MKKLSLIVPLLSLSALLTVPAAALEYNIAAPSGPEYGRPTSIETVQTPDGGATKNEDLSKNTALVPPAFGSPSAYTLTAGAVLTPILAVEGTPSGNAGVITAPPALGGSAGGTPAASAAFTAVTTNLYYANGSLGTLSIPRLGVSVKIFEGTDSAALAKGVGHFIGTSIWNGNASFAAHNRGVNAHFGQIHTLNAGDIITLTTKLGTRTYSVVSVEKVLETDVSGLSAASENCITLYTCVRDQPAYRWCVKGVVIM